MHDSDNTHPAREEMNGAASSDRRSFLLSLMAGAAGVATGLAGCARGRRPDPFPPLVLQADPLPESQRLFTLRPGLTYLDTATLGSVSQTVHQAQLKAMEALNADPAEVYTAELDAVLERIRSRAAELLQVSAGEIAVAGNTTAGMNLVASGLALRAGDEVLTTTEEHPGGFYCWKYLADRLGITVRTFTPPDPLSDPAQLVELVQKNLTPATRVVSLSHVAYTTGLVYPLQAISEVIRPRGLFLVVDGAQAPGQMGVSLRELGVDTYATSGHKWLCAPRGTGLLYVRRAVQDEVRPLMAGTGAYRTRDARRYEAVGTRHLPALVGLGAALDLYRALGPGRVETRVRYLASRLRQSLREQPGVRLLTPTGMDLSCGITTFRTHDMDACAMAVWLRRDHGIQVKPITTDRWQGLRVSTHYFNTPEELDRVVTALGGTRTPITRPD